MQIKEIKSCPDGSEVTLQGWVLTRRDSGQITFLHLYDGSTQTPFQAIIETPLGKEVLPLITTGSSVELRGILVQSPGGKQNKELQVKSIQLLDSAAPNEYPLQPKRHTMEFLRTIPHLRLRTRTFRAIMAIRARLSYAIHHFFTKENFFHIHTPIITGMDAEGAGELFELHTGNELFFGKPTYLTVSGQLAGEAAAMGMGKIYTFGPTFRAERSHTRRHLAEFWMVEPEMSFFNLAQTTSLAEKMIQQILNDLLDTQQDELLFLTQKEEEKIKRQGKPTIDPLIDRIKKVASQSVVQITYTKAIDLLQKEAKKLIKKNPLRWGDDLQSIHEQWLTQHFNCATIVTNYPKEIKAFYMRLDENEKTVAGFDMLLPNIGEVIGGSQREERYEYLLAAIDRCGINSESLQWYLDTRRFGSVIHSGFGLGFDRLVQWCSGVENIRDVIMFPRTPGQALG